MRQGRATKPPERATSCAKMPGMMPQSPRPDFRAPAFLRAHIADVMAFYEGRCVDPSGGFYQFFKDDGSVYDARTRHLVSSTRYVFTQAMGAQHLGRPE